VNACSTCLLLFFSGFAAWLIINKDAETPKDEERDKTLNKAAFEEYFSSLPESGEAIQLKRKQMQEAKEKTARLQKLVQSRAVESSAIPRRVAQITSPKKFGNFSSSLPFFLSN
jgi:hypothetical protein